MALLVQTIGVVVFAALYDRVYSQQMTVLVAMGCVTFILTFVHGFHKRACEPLLRRVALTIYDIGTLVVVQACSTVMQGEVWYRSLSATHYNIGHGYWHVGCAVVAIIVPLLLLRDDCFRIPTVDRVVQGGFSFFMVLMTVVVTSSPESRLVTASLLLYLLMMVGLGVAWWPRCLRAVRASARGGGP